MTAADLQLFPEPAEGDGEAEKLHAQDSISCASGAVGKPGKPPTELKVHKPIAPDEAMEQALQKLAQPEPDAFPRLDGGWLGSERSGAPRKVDCECCL